MLPVSQAKRLSGDGRTGAVQCWRTAPKRVATTRNLHFGCRVTRERLEVAIIPAPSSASVGGSGTLVPAGGFSGVTEARAATTDAACSLLIWLRLAPPGSRVSRLASGRPAVQSALSTSTSGFAEQVCLALDGAFMPVQTRSSGSDRHIPSQAISAMARLPGSLYAALFTSSPRSGAVMQTIRTAIEIQCWAYLESKGPPQVSNFVVSYYTLSYCNLNESKVLCW